MLRFQAEPTNQLTRATVLTPWLQLESFSVRVVLTMIRVCAFALVLASTGVTTSATPAQSHPQISPEQRAYVEAQTANQRAQARYAQEQATELAVRRSRPAWQAWVQDYSVGVAAVVGALITILSFINTWQQAVSSAWETQFFDALKRLGDRDSPIVRANAASMLSVMLLRRRPGFFPRTLTSKSRLYYDATFSGFLTALTLESDESAIRSIRGAALSLVRSGDTAAELARKIFRVRRVRSDLRYQFNEAVGYYLAAYRAREPDIATNRERIAFIIRPLVRTTGTLDIKREVLRTRDVQAAFGRFALLSTETQIQIRAAALTNLRAAYERIAAVARVALDAAPVDPDGATTGRFAKPPEPAAKPSTT